MRAPSPGKRCGAPAGCLTRVDPLVRRRPLERLWSRRFLSAVPHLPTDASQEPTAPPPSSPVTPADSNVGPVTPVVMSAARSTPVAHRAWRAARSRLVLRVAGIAGAATAGTVAGFGLRREGVAEPFAAVGQLVLGAAATERGPVRLATIAAGLLLHFALVAAWTLLFARLAGVGRRRPLEVPPVAPRIALAAAVTGLTAFIADSRILPALLQIGYGAEVFGPQSWLLHAVLSGALVVGMRLAPSRLRDDD